MKGGSGKGAALDATVMTVDHDVPTDQSALKELRLRQADAAIAAAEAKVAKQEAFVENAPRGTKDRAREHLAGAKLALAQAISAKEKLAD